MMCQMHVRLLVLMMLSCLTCAEDKMKVPFFSPGYQRAFRGSLYDFVFLQRTFFSAQVWCEKRGGHLAFIPDEETQHFLQKHLDPQKDTWLGAAPSGSANLQNSPADAGPLSWLDGSHITYSRWVSRPEPGAAYGHILRNSGFHWKTTTDGDMKLAFICQYESGKSIVCGGCNTPLQCGSGQVLMIDAGFYGRKNGHYCRSIHSPPTPPTLLQCGWVDVTKPLTAHCHGRQACQISEAVDSFGDPCPQLGSYLSLDYHCKEGLSLSVSSVAAIFDAVTISVKWLLHVKQGNLSCKLSPGDGHVIYLYSPEGSENSVVHKYSYPGAFVVSAECASSDNSITAQSVIAVQEPIGVFEVTVCYAGNLSFHVTSCKALYAEQLQIQVGLTAGTDVTYRIRSGDMLLSGLSVVRGNVPQNITVSADNVKHVGPGCHQLTLCASNRVSLPVCEHLQMCVLEKVWGLQAFLLTERDDSPDIAVGVSLERGVPVTLLFSLTGDNSSISETREMTTRKGFFNIEHWIQGSIQVKITAWNIFSSSEENVEILASCAKDSATKKHIRVPRSSFKINARPSSSIDEKQSIVLYVNADSSEEEEYKWRCKNPCTCQRNSEGPTYTITEECLPKPFEFNKYHAEVKKKKTESICITFTPKLSNLAKLGCTEGCDLKKQKDDVKLKFECDQAGCSKVEWYIEQTDQKDWQKETKSCYIDAGTNPFEKIKDGGTEHTVSKKIVAKAKGQDITVVTVFGDSANHYTSYTLKTSSSNENSATTTKNSVTTVTIATSAGPATTSPPTTGATTVPSVTTTPSTTENVPSPSTTSSSDQLKCSISPLNGTILDAFKITCITAVPCSKCQYCFKTDKGKHLRCSNSNEVKSVFLPLGDRESNYSLIIKATAKSGSFVVNSTITTQVLDSTAESSVSGLKAAVKNAVAQLKALGLLSGETVGQIFNTVSNKLNDQTDDSTEADRQKLREQMLDIMIATVKEVPPKSPEEVQVTAKALSAVIQKSSELSASAQEEASLFLASLSSSLLHMGVTNSEEIHSAASAIVEGTSNMLDSSSNKNISDALLVAMANVQSALLAFKSSNEEPTIIQQAHIKVMVNRVTPDNLHTKLMNIPNCSCPAFSLPKLPSNVLPSDEPVDIRMLSLGKNPFSWNKRGNITGEIGALSLTKKDGSNIIVENLNEDIEILLPRPEGEEVKTSVLDLRNFSTAVIDLPSANTTLVLKMVPSNDPLPFKLLLGYMDYPTDSSYVAMTEMPHRGTTQEERYTWIVEAKNLKGNTGVHYLVVRPVVGPGIKSVNASLTISSIVTACKYWDESILDWNDYGCRVGVKTSHLVTQCLCNHLTFFGSSFFVTPNLVDPSRSAELFGTFAENPVVVCCVGALSLAYLLALVWARRKDIQDATKVKVTVLEDNDPVDEYRYMLCVSTGHRRGASTSSQVTITLVGADGNSEPHHLTDPKKRVFERGAVDLFLLTAPYSLGKLQAIRLWHNNSGSHPPWYVGNVMVQDLQTEQKWHFLCNTWLAIDIGDCSLDKDFPVSTEMELKRFRNLFFMKTSKDFSDGHLWFSVISRPPSSSFTCVQRVSCCFSLLLCTMLTSIMFYGIPTDPSEQTLDLGHFEFTWQQFMIGVQSSLIMFPINIVIVSIFRNTCRWETSCCKNKKESDKLEALEQSCSPQAPTSNVDVHVTLEAVITDITRIAHSLSKTMKSNIPFTEPEFGPGQEIDINAVLSVVDDFIRQNNKTSDTSQFKTQSVLVQPQLTDGSDSFPPGSTVDGSQMKSNKTQYLYRQLCQIDEEMGLLGPSGFHSPHSYSQAVQQVQGMKAFLEDQILKSSGANIDEILQKKLSTADGADGDGRQTKRVCCHGGLPWCFIFIGWLLIIGTSVVSGYFTMLYGLKFGKDRSISWLVSMIISFFQSLLIIQPLKVVCLAVFFALIIKKVEEDDYQNVEFVRNTRNAGEWKDQQTVRRDSSLYEPPPPADIERMRRNRILEQKAFALLLEILTYMGFMWMLLLVAYGQRDPNGFYLNKHIRSSFSTNISDSMRVGDVFIWANTCLLSNLFGLYSGFITDGNSKLVGSARLRQLRVRKSSCEIAGSMLQFVPDCNAPYVWDMEDRGRYGPGWNRSVGDNVSTSVSSPWRYQTQAQLRAYPIWGRMVLYRGGGFVAELGPDLQNASSTLEYLLRNKWLDMYTRVIFVEFTAYNANVNLFCIVTFMFETAATGAFQFNSELHSVRLYQSTGGLHIFVMAAEIMYLLFILYYMFLQGKLMRQQRWAYFTGVWNLLELTIILLSWSAVAVFAKRTLLGNRDMAYYLNHKDQLMRKAPASVPPLMVVNVVNYTSAFPSFASFYETATADSLLQYLIAFLVLFSSVKLWHLLRLNPKMNMISATLQRAWSDVSGFLVILVIMLVAYSTVSNVIYGWKISSYRTLADALVTIVSLQTGIFNYEEVLNCSPVLGGLLFGSCIVFMTFMVLNLLISVILVSFSQEQIHHKPSDEEEIVDLMLEKICGLFGIPYKSTEDTPGADVSGTGDLNYKNILINSTNDVKTSVKL